MTVWPTFLGMMAATVAAGTLAVPLAPRWSVNAAQWDWLRDELELDRIEPDGRTVRAKSGTVTRVWRLHGIAYDARPADEQEALLLGRAALMRELGRLKVALRLFGVKRRRELGHVASWPSAALAEIGAAEAGRFRASYRIDWYVMATAGAHGQLNEAHDRIVAMMDAYRPVALERAPSGGLCPLTSFLAGLVCGEYPDDHPGLTADLTAATAISDLRLDRESGIIESHARERTYHRTIAVLQWPESVSGRLIGALMAIDGDIELCQIAEPHDRDLATVLYKRRERGASGSLLGNPAAAAEASVMVDELNADAVAMFTTQFQITVSAGDKDRLAALVRSVLQVMGRERIQCAPQRAGIAACWFSRMPPPGGTGKSVMPGARFMAPLDLRDENIAALWPFPHSPTGLASSQFGDAPVRLFATPSGQAYAFQFQAENKPQARGNYLVFAPTGGGKSTLMMHLLGGLAKFEGVRSYIFDSKEGARFMVEAMGGCYQSYDELALNPLDVGDDTPQNRQRVYAILRAMAGDTALGEDDKQALMHAAETAFLTDPPERTLDNVFPFAFTRRTELRRAFRKWVTDDRGERGHYAHVFNAGHDSLGGLLDRFMVAINMNEALDDPALGAPVVAHIAATIGQRAAARAKGFTIFIDEAAKLLANEGFRELALEMFREYRKLNGAVGLAFQDPGALWRSEQAEAFIENTATLIFIPNTQARAESFAPFNLNDEQMGFVLGRGGQEPGARRALIIKRDAAAGLDESAIIDIDLAPLGTALRYYRAGVDANRALAGLKQAWGNDWRDHL